MMTDIKARHIQLELESSEAEELRDALNQASQSRNSLRIGLQPLLIQDSESIVPPNFTTGGGLFRRGLVLPHKPNPPTRSLSCVCDNCQKSFRVQTHICGPFSGHFHDEPIGGFLYSQSGIFTLLIPPQVDGCPLPTDANLQENMTEEMIEKRESFIASLPKAPDGSGWSIDSGFNCPYCQTPYVDYKKHPGERLSEMYALSLFEQPENVFFFDPQEGIRPIDDFHFRHLWAQNPSLDRR